VIDKNILEEMEIFKQDNEWSKNVYYCNIIEDSIDIEETDTLFNVIDKINSISWSNGFRDGKKQRSKDLMELLSN